MEGFYVYCFSEFMYIVSGSEQMTSVIPREALDRKFRFL